MIVTHFSHPHLKLCIKYIVNSCDACLCSKLPGMEYGELPPQEAGIVPWNEVTVDLIGPWTANVQGTNIMFCTLACIDPVSNLVKSACGIHKKSGITLAQCLRIYGLQGTPVHCVAYMTMAVNLLAQIFSTFLRSMNSRTYLLQSRIHSPMQSAKECIRLQVTCCALSH
jgi:hypothetical protein